MPEGLFFDLGDTLVDLRDLIPAMVGTLRSRFPAIGSPGDVALAWVYGTARDTHAAQGPRFRPGPEIAGIALARSLLEVGVELPLQESVALVHAAWDEFVKTAKFHPDASPALFQELRKRVRATGIITDSDTSAVHPLLEKLGVYSLFDVVVVSDMVGAYKPDPRIYQAALDRAKVDAGASLFVSDSVVDLEGSQNVGMEAIWIKRNPERHRGPDPPGVKVVSSLTELMRLVPEGR